MINRKINNRAVTEGRRGACARLRSTNACTNGVLPCVEGCCAYGRAARQTRLRAGLRYASEDWSSAEGLDYAGDRCAADRSVTRSRLRVGDAVAYQHNAWHRMFVTFPGDCVCASYLQRGKSAAHEMRRVDTPYAIVSCIVCSDHVDHVHDLKSYA